jgi:hypothetical protein
MNFTYFAQLDENNIVTQVIVADQSFVDSIGGTWIETFMDSDKKYAGIGDTHNATLNAFISPKCHIEATLDEATCQWNCSNEAHTIKEIN